jgi:hypothetical protein
MNEREVGLWTVGNSGASGLRVRMNDALNNGVDGLFLFKTDGVRFEAGGFDVLIASDIFCNSIGLLDSATIRFVVEDAGQFYISESSPEFVVGGSGYQTDAFSANALEINWFNYDPVSAASNVSVIGTSATPAFTDIDFIGFTLFADGSSSNSGGVNWGVRLFNASAATNALPTTPAELWEAWISGFSVGANTGLLDHADSDDLDNLTEYAWGGNPADGSILGNIPLLSEVSAGGTNYLEYVYFERIDAASRGLSNILDVGTDLVAADWTDGSSYEVGRGAAAGKPDFNAVTNRIPVDAEDIQFIRLQIEYTP